MIPEVWRKILCIFGSCCMHAGFSLASDHHAPIKIIADTVVIQYVKHITTLHGHVILTQGSTKITGETVILYSDAQQSLVRLVAEGNSKQPAEYSTLPETGRALFIASADHIVYFNAEKRVNFLGDAHATDGRNHFQGPNFSYWTEQQKVITKKNTQQPSTLFIMPATSALS